MISTETQQLTMVGDGEFDYDKAEALAERLGYTQTAYTSTSSLWGLFCLRDSAEDHKREGCIIHTRELGLLFVIVDEDVA